MSISSFSVGHTGSRPALPILRFKNIVSRAQALHAAVSNIPLEEVHVLRNDATIMNPNQAFREPVRYGKVQVFLHLSFRPLRSNLVNKEHRIVNLHYSGYQSVIGCVTQPGQSRTKTPVGLPFSSRMIWPPGTSMGKSPIISKTFGDTHSACMSIRFKAIGTSFSAGDLSKSDWAGATIEMSRVHVSYACADILL
jgi:hypothetical protein